MSIAGRFEADAERVGMETLEHAGLLIRDAACDPTLFNDDSVLLVDTPDAVIVNLNDATPRALRGSES